MGILKALACCSLFLSIGFVNGANATPPTESEILVEVDKCLTPLAHSIFEQVYKMPYKDEYDINPGGGGAASRFETGISTRDCSEPTSPNCLHFQTKDFMIASWSFEGRIPNANPAELEWRSMRVRVEAIPGDWRTKLTTNFNLNSGMASVYLNALELLPQMAMVSDFDVVGRDFVGREIISQKGLPRLEFLDDILPPLGDSSVLFNGDYATQIRVNLRSYDECIRKILK